MKIRLNIILGTVCMAVLLFSCGKYQVQVAPGTPIDIGGIPVSYAALGENTDLKIPIKFTTPVDSGLASASYKLVNTRANVLLPVFSPAVNIPVHGRSIDTTISVPVRRGLISVVITIYDKTGKMSSQSIDLKSVTGSDAALKTLTGVVMSTDPADNQNFFSLYEANPVFGRADALNKQGRIDFVLVNMTGARAISCHAYGAGADYYAASKAVLAGFTSLSYSFVSATKTYVSRSNFNAITKESDLAAFVNDSVIAPTTKGGANYNVMSADRRVGDSYTETAVEKGFLFGWGLHTNPVATPVVVLNESFGLIIVKNCVKKANGHYVITFDVKASATDQRAGFWQSAIAPYDPYPL